jgi:hypothetical protein
MKAPIFVVCADDEVLVYEEPTRALQYTESPDVEGGEYLAVFDADGRRFELHVAEPTRRRKGPLLNSIELTPVTFRALEETPTGADDLRRILAERLPDAPPGAPLEELVRRASKTFPSP